jgi:hypothetical protein
MGKMSASRRAEYVVPLVLGHMDGSPRDTIR